MPQFSLGLLVASNGGTLRVSERGVQMRDNPQVFVYSDPCRADTVLTTRERYQPDALKGWRFIFRGGE